MSISTGTLDTFVYDYGKPLWLIDEVSDVRPIRGGVLFSCGTRAYHRRTLERYGTFVEVGEGGEAGDTFYVQIVEVSPGGVLRIQSGRDQGAFDQVTPMLDGAATLAVEHARLEESSGSTQLHTTELVVIVKHAPFEVRISSASDGRLLWSSLPTGPFQHPPTGMSDLHGASMTDAWPWFFRRLLPFGFVEDTETGEMQSFVTARLFHDEHLYGFGEVYSDLDKRGEHIDIWHANATGNTWPESYKSYPFFLSSRGYGLFVNSARPVAFHLGDLSRTRYSIQNQSDTLDLFFIHGPRYTDVLPRYAALTGRPALPPLWSFGLWMSRMSYRSQDQVEEVARELRTREIPADVIHIDTDWFEKPWINDLSFSRERFPDPAGMLERLRKQHFRLSLWQIPYISEQSPLFREGKDGGYFAIDGEGSIRMLDGFFGPAAIIDYTNTQAVAWMQRHLRRLFELGVSCIKTDFGEGAPPDARYRGADGAEIHNLYPLLYNRAFFEESRDYAGEGIVWARSGYIGSQRYPVHWGGDPAALWEDLGNLWHGGLGLGLSGVPFWSIDIGGFGGTPSPALYIRWMQAGLFVSHPRAHGPIGREPWVFGAESERLFRAYATLRYRLLPYVWTEARHAVDEALPMHRALLVDWQEDPTTSSIDDEYLFGRELLVAPVLEETSARRVYLPGGPWFDFWTDRRIDGPCWLDRAAPLEDLPLYVRADAVLPLIAPVLSTDEADFTRVDLHLYPVKGGRRAVSLPNVGELTVLTEFEQNSDSSDSETLMVRLSGASVTARLIVHGGTVETEHTDRSVPAAGTVVDTIPVASDAGTTVRVTKGFHPGRTGEQLE